MKYTVDITKKYMKTVTVTLPDTVAEKDVREFVDEAIDDLFDLEKYQGQEQWDESDFFDTPTKMLVECSSDDDFEYVVDGFGKAT